MKANDMIRKWDMSLAEQNGQVAIKIHGKATEKQVAAIKAAKPQIIEELQRRAQERATAEAQRQAEEAAERATIMSGEKPIQLKYHDGEYLSGWAPVGQSSRIMEELGLVKYVSGWGSYIEPKTLEELGGPEFTYQQALELSQARAQAKEAKRADAEAARQAKFDEAKATGKPVLLRQWNTDCCSRDEECDLDNHYEYAMPDGSVEHKWNHTW